MAILLNGERTEWREGTTVESLIQEKKFTFPLKNVVLNGRRIARTDYAQTPIQDGDTIDIIHMISGG
jgi:sulfur carrier protein